MTVGERWECPRCGRAFSAVGPVGFLAERVRSHVGACAGPRRAAGRPVAVPAEVAARIAGEYRAGVGLRAIARGLNDGGVPTAGGGVRWYASTVRGVLGRCRPDGLD